MPVYWTVINFGIVGDIEIDGQPVGLALTLPVVTRPPTHPDDGLVSFYPRPPWSGCRRTSGSVEGLSEAGGDADTDHHQADEHGGVVCAMS
ncbi:MAG: hypothetical protein R3F42_06055 [Pseudomonadota bacterium]